MRRAAATVACAALLLATTEVRADDKPFPQGTLSLGLNLGGSFGGNINVLTFGGGLTYFLWGGRWNSLGLGFSFDDTIYFFSDNVKASFPGIEKQVPTNILRLTPRAQFLIVRTRWFTPYVTGGVGPTFFNNGGGVVGHWVAGAGAFIGVGRRVFIDVGVGFTGMFPRQQCQDAFLWNDGIQSVRVFDPSPCAIRWGPRLGLTGTFGGGGGKRRDKDKRKRRRDRDEEPEPDHEPDEDWGAEDPAPDLEPPPAVETTPEPETVADPGGAEPAPDATEPSPDGARPAPDADATPDPDAAPGEPDEPAPGGEPAPDDPATPGAPDPEPGAAGDDTAAPGGAAGTEETNPPG